MLSLLSRSSLSVERRLLQQRAAGFSTTSPSSSSSSSPTDIVIAGGGIMGHACAYFLAHKAVQNKLPPIKITLVERDPTYQFASTSLSAAGVRHQFSTRENIEISMFTTKFLREFNTHLGIQGDSPLDPQFREQGYLFLSSSEEGEQTLRENVALQQSLGADVHLMNPVQLAKRFPFLNVSDLRSGAFGESGEGFFDPHMVSMAFRSKAKEFGVQFVHGEVSGFEIEASSSSSSSSSSPSAAGKQVKQVRIKPGSGAPSYSVLASHVINATGPRARQTVSMLHDAEIRACSGSGVILPSASGSVQPSSGSENTGLPFPVVARKRCVFVIDHRPPSRSSPSLYGPCSSFIDPLQTGLTIDPLSGAYFRPEKGSKFLCGMCPPEGYPDPDVAYDDFEVDHSLFENHIWPALAHRVPTFENIKVVGSWAGHYAMNTVDANAILGPHPRVENFYFINGFSGHGVQQAPGMARAMSELLLPSPSPASSSSSSSSATGKVNATEKGSAGKPKDGSRLGCVAAGDDYPCRSSYETIDLSQFSYSRIAQAVGGLKPGAAARRLIVEKNVV